MNVICSSWLARPLAMARTIFSVGCMLIWFLWSTIANAASPEEIEFFEKKVRPILSDNCFKCHSHSSEKLKGGLMLDSREGLVKGGDDGPVINPDKPLDSRLLVAIQYQNPDLQMPPKRKLTGDQITALTEWIKMGAPWPAEKVAVAKTPPTSFDLEKRRREHWAWQPVKKVVPPSVADPKWAATAPDRFLLARLEQQNLRPAAPVEPRILIRRLFFDLIGLPPTPEQVESFVSSHSDADYRKVIDELLNSPHFGERWARHWLDLVRYSETLGHEFDYAIPNAWRYRDYVIRAFNEDVPYQQFVTEHLAGDLLPNPRRDPVEHFNESVIGTGFLWLGQREHSPVDVRLHQAEVIDNQIDVLSKTFLGLTVACARCHDHKFDAIGAQDYYSMYGILESCRYSQTSIDDPVGLKRKIDQLVSIKEKIIGALAGDWSEQSAFISQYLLATTTLASTNATDGHGNLNPRLIERWSAALSKKDCDRPDHPLFAWATLAHSVHSNGSFHQLCEKLVANHAQDRQADLRTNDPSVVLTEIVPFADWFFEGAASAGPAEARPGLIMQRTEPRFTIPEPGAARDSFISTRLEGSQRSPSFEIREPFIHVRIAGHKSRVKICVDNFTMIRDPIYGGLKKFVDSDWPTWLTFDVRMWTNHRAFIEITDVPTPDLTDDSGGAGYGPSGFFAVEDVVFNSSNKPPGSNPAWAILFKDQSINSLAELAAAYQEATRRALLDWRTPGKSRSPNPAADLVILNSFLEHDLLAQPADSNAVAQLSEFRRLEDALPQPVRVPSMVEADGFDERIFIRGNHKTPGEKAPRRLLAALTRQEDPPFKNGSGRLELAEHLTDPTNPLLARVIVNRVWLHLYGRGIVATPDDFGVLGQPPSHPELLDWLADWFQTEAHGSIKKLIRLLVCSSAYRMSSQPADPVAEEQDPENILLHRMSIRRLEGEIIRDAMLADSGRLNPKMFGPPVPIYLSEFMEGTGRPGSSGPLDGAGRRSIYQEVRRNFLSPMMRSFDAPIPFTTIGLRTLSNLPAQSLILLNDPFVMDQAKAWARKLIASDAKSPTDRIRQIYLTAFGRPPRDFETSKALDFLRQEASTDGLSESQWNDSEKLWADLCHVVFNLKEFIFIQ